MWKVKPPSALYLSRVKAVFYEHILSYSSDHAGMLYLTGCIKIKKAQIIRFVLFTCMRGFEPPTPWSVAKCSIQLSYTHIFYLLIHYNTLVKCFEWMPQTGIEPVLYHYNRILSPARLPVPPLRHEWDLQGSNLWPSACKADALPAELRSRSFVSVTRTPLLVYTLGV